MSPPLQTYATASTPPRVFAPLRSGILRRKCACGGTPGVEGECAECRGKRLRLQRRADSRDGPSLAPPIVYDVLDSPARGLDADARAFMEPRLGHDLSRVRIHTHSKAAESARAVNALAYAVGHNVVFGAGPTDPAEAEADAAATAVVRGAPFAPRLRGLDGECAACRAKRLGLRRQAGERAGFAPVPPIVREVLRSPGQPLDPDARDFMEARFGHDFTRVRVHTDAKAAESAKAVHALAYTVGPDVVFGAGQYAPRTAAGRHLLAHELAHVLQQQPSPRRRHEPTRLGDPDGSPDAEAERVAEDVAGIGETTPVGYPLPITRVSGVATLQRRWDAAVDECGAGPPDPWIRKVIVRQETPQSVALEWSDGTGEDDIVCSSGKGWCCVPDERPTAVACTTARSRETGTNCTPLGSDHRIRNRDLDHRGIPFWSEFVPSRGIALHEFSPVDGTPLSHGCVRLHLDAARKIFCNARQNRTVVEVTGFARPRCSHPALQTEWAGDLAEAAGPEPLDPRQRYLYYELRRSLRRAMGLGARFTDFGTLTVPDDIPRCAHTSPLPLLPSAPGGTPSPGEKGAGVGPEAPQGADREREDTSDALAVLQELRQRAVADAFPFSAGQREELDRA